ncbi:MAG: hypothetical protein LBT45_03075 [Rickettsiales bacterium]|jgi:hypothetical protein|nr:hypothetical protein [Rickettsiales bacterium]
MKRFCFFMVAFFGAVPAAQSLPTSGVKVSSAGSAARSPTSVVKVSAARTAATPARMSIGSFVKKQISSGVTKPIVVNTPSAPANNATLEKLEDDLDDLKARVEDIISQGAPVDLSGYYTAAEVDAALDDKQDSLPDTAGNAGKVLSVGAGGLEWVTPAGGGTLTFTSDVWTE